MADAVACAKAGQKVPQGYYNLELMTKAICRGGEVLLCGTCMDARGIADVELVEGTQRSTLAELAERTLAAGQVLVFWCPGGPALRDAGDGMVVWGLLLSLGGMIHPAALDNET